ERVLRVADAGLGTLTAVRLSADAFAAPELWVHLNRYDETSDLHRRNRAWLAERARYGARLSTDLDSLVAGGARRPPHPRVARRARAVRGAPQHRSRRARGGRRGAPPGLLPPLRPRTRGLRRRL